MISATNVAKQTHAKNSNVYHNAGCHPKCDKVIIKMGTTGMGFNFNKADWWFKPLVLPFDSFCFQQRFV